MRARTSAVRNCLLGGLCSLALGCHVDASSDARDAAAVQDASAETPTGTLFGIPVSSFVTLADGSVSKVGVSIPLSALEAAPTDGPFQDELILEMPLAAKRQTFLSQLRVNWLAHGHGPEPYGAPHFDFHFFRGSTREIDAIACTGSADFPPEILTSDHQSPTSCVARMGYHAWPSADAASDAAFSASLILGYLPTQLVFIEPMITQATLLARRDFELAITPPERNGGAPTRYPTLMRASYEGEVLRMEFDAFVDLD